MSNYTKIFAGVITIGAIGLFIILSKKNTAKKSEAERFLVAEEGYETAQDILFPISKYRVKH